MTLKTQASRACARLWRCVRLPAGLGFALMGGFMILSAAPASAIAAEEGAAALVSPEFTGAIEPVAPRKIGKSGYPLPRFASLKSNNINMRVGPGTENAILWTYVKAGLPVEIVLEFENWRKIRDADGVEGWVMQTMLSNRRTAIVEPGFAKRPGDIEAIIEASDSAPELTVPLFATPDDTSRRVALLEPGVTLSVITCDGQWCSVSAGKHGGWIEKTRIWGVYSDEMIDD
jgi:SH3-like domain-containing protein